MSLSRHGALHVASMPKPTGRDAKRIASPGHDRAETAVPFASAASPSPNFSNMADGFSLHRNIVGSGKDASLPRARAMLRSKILSVRDAP